ncbi:muscle M-line assembly protein unc-89-like [Cydia pomonella]|uniref:muscle M-line assembly protein unc-89-like n=1 Tax=Cydia pomonella TaxID=82600 RepID=UPI002ADE0EA7|nr:muscle M-line assembly protein unc-89-like [Cydia pomonella]XP_061704394.1 muscle M-line assembly protein unc-89-like [Cydia pomonella]
MRKVVLLVILTHAATTKAQETIVTKEEATTESLKDNTSKQASRSASKLFQILQILNQLEKVLETIGKRLAMELDTTTAGSTGSPKMEVTKEETTKESPKEMEVTKEETTKESPKENTSKKPSDPTSELLQLLLNQLEKALETPSNPTMELDTTTAGSIGSPKMKATKEEITNESPKENSPKKPSDPTSKLIQLLLNQLEKSLETPSNPAMELDTTTAGSTGSPKMEVTKEETTKESPKENTSKEPSDPTSKLLQLLINQLEKALETPSNPAIEIEITTAGSARFSKMEVTKEETTKESPKENTSKKPSDSTSKLIQLLLIQLEKSLETPSNPAMELDTTTVGSTGSPKMEVINKETEI